MTRRPDPIWQGPFLVRYGQVEERVDSWAALPAALARVPAGAMVTDIASGRLVPLAECRPQARTRSGRMSAAAAAPDPSGLFMASAPAPAPPAPEEAMEESPAWRSAGASPAAVPDPSGLFMASAPSAPAAAGPGEAPAPAPRKRPPSAQRMRHTPPAADAAPADPSGAAWRWIVCIGLVVTLIVLIAIMVAGGMRDPVGAAPAAQPVAAPVAVSLSTPPPTPAPASHRAADAPRTGADPVPAGLVAHYRFDGADLARDASGGNHRASMVSGVAWADRDPRIGTYGIFDENSRMVIPRLVAVDFSISFWLHTAATGGDGSGSGGTGQWFHGIGLVDAEVPAHAEDFGVTLVAGRIAFGIGLPDTTLFSRARVDDGDWHHVAVTRDSGFGRMRIYVDGVPAATRDGPRGERVAPARISIGRMNGGSRPLTGRLAHVRLYDRVLDEDEVARINTWEGGAAR